jgi:hypothetical protein
MDLYIRDTIIALKVALFFSVFFNVFLGCAIFIFGTTASMARGCLKGSASYQECFIDSGAAK